LRGACYAKYIRLDGEEGGGEGRGHTPLNFWWCLKHPLLGGYPPSLDRDPTKKKKPPKMNTFTWRHVKIENIRFHVTKNFSNNFYCADKRFHIKK